MGFGSFIPKTDTLPYLAKLYFKIFGVLVLGSKQRYELMQNMLRVKKWEITLDIGSGGGINALSLAEDGCRVVGIDVSKEGIKKGMNRSKILNGSSFILADGRNIPLKEKSFDKILCLEVLEHIRDDGKAAAEIARVLKVGGRACISVPHGNPKKTYDKNSMHVREGYTQEDLEHLFERYGLRLKDVIYFEKTLARISKRMYFKLKDLFGGGDIFYSHDYISKFNFFNKIYSYIVLPVLFPILGISYSLDFYLPDKKYSSIMALFETEGGS